jgi:hypothetical protein
MRRYAWAVIWCFVSPSEKSKAVIFMPNDDFADLLWGAQAIADYIGKNYRQTIYLLSTKRLPAQKIGATWVACRSKLRARLLG